MFSLSLGFILLVDGFIDNFSGMGDHTARQNIVVQVDFEQLLFFVPIFLDQVEQIVGVHIAGVAAHLAGPIATADNDYAVGFNNFAGNGSLNVAAVLCGHIDDYTAGLHTLYYVSTYQ